MSGTVHDLIAGHRPPSVSQISASLGGPMRPTRPNRAAQRGIRSSGNLIKMVDHAQGWQAGYDGRRR